MEVNPADVAGVRIRYKLGTAEFSIALSALYQLLLNPQRGCAILSGLREWERSRRLTDTWAANTPCWAALGELGWEGCSDEDILMSSCGMKAPTPASPRSASPAKPAPAEKPKPPAAPPPPPNPRKARSAHRRASPSNRAAARRRTRHFTVPMGRGRGSRRNKSGARSPPPWRGMSHLTPCLVSRCLCPTPMVSTRGL